MIRLRNLERRYPLAQGKFFYVLRDINIDIAEGEFVSVMGPSGAGKSTLLHILGMSCATSISTSRKANLFP